MWCFRFIVAVLGGPGNVGLISVVRSGDRFVSEEWHGWLLQMEQAGRGEEIWRCVDLGERDSGIVLGLLVTVPVRVFMDLGTCDAGF